MALTTIDDRGLKTPIDLLDGEKIRFGTGNDLEIYHSGSDSYIKDTGTGSLHVRGSDLYLADDDGTNMLYAANNAGVSLYYGGGKKFETTSTGSTVSGILRIGDSGTGGATNAIYVGAGDDLKIYHDGSNTYIDNFEGNLNLRLVDGGDHSPGSGNYHTALRAIPNSTTELYYDNAKRFETTTDGAQVTGKLFADNGFWCKDNDVYRCGDDTDLMIYHDDSHAWIKNSTGYLRLAAAGSGVTISNGDNTEAMASFVKNGSVELFYDNAKKFETTSTGATVTGNLQSYKLEPLADDTYDIGTSSLRWRDAFIHDGVDLPNDGKLKLGDSDDLQIYHDGSNSYIKHTTASSDVYFQATRDIYLQPKAAENGIAIKADGAVELYYDNGKKAETVTGGFTVTGTCTATSFAGDGSNLTGISGGSTTDDQYNVKIGAGAGDDFSGTSANDNILIGKDAGTDITSADENVAIGTNALANSTTGSNNIAIGKDSSADMTNKGHCVAIGTRALKEAAGDQNIGIGTNTGYSLTSGEQNIAIGYDALYNGTTATGCVAIGRDAQKTNYGNPADYVVAIGYEALKVNRKDKTVGIGYQALKANSTGERNTVLGSEAGSANTTGCDQVLIGYQAGKENNGHQNTLIGGSSGLYMDTGEYNVAIGCDALRCASGTATHPDNNVAIGGAAMKMATEANENVAVGVNAMFDVTTASECVAIGRYALRNVLAGGRNTAVGYNSMTDTEGGENNTCIGYEAGGTISSGNYNVCVGRLAGVNQITTGSDNLYIARSNGAAGTSGTWIYGNVSGECIQGDNATSWSTTSDRRLKKNIVDSPKGLTEIDKLRVTNFEYRKEDEIDMSEFPLADSPNQICINDEFKEGVVQTGVIAQEVEAVLPECIKVNDKGAKTVSTDPIMWALVNAVKELSAKVKALESA